MKVHRNCLVHCSHLQSSLPCKRGGCPCVGQAQRRPAAYCACLAFSLVLDLALHVGSTRVCFIGWGWGDLGCLLFLQQETAAVAVPAPAYMRVGIDQSLVTDCLCCHTSSIVLQSQPFSFRGLPGAKQLHAAGQGELVQGNRLLDAPWLDVLTTLDDQGCYFAHLWLSHLTNDSCSDRWFQRAEQTP